MPKLSPRDAVKVYQVSRATLMKSLANGTVSGSRDDAGHWQIDAAELMRVYSPRTTVGRTIPDQMNRNEIPLDHDAKADDLDLAVRLAIAETALAAEREKTALLQRHLDDVRMMLSPPDDARPRRRRWTLWM
jgi:hypothetical protein